MDHNAYNNAYRGFWGARISLFPKSHLASVNAASPTAGPAFGRAFTSVCMDGGVLVQLTTQPAPEPCEMEDVDLNAAGNRIDRAK